MLRQLRRWTIAPAIALGLLVGMAAPAGAAELPVDGSYSGTAVLTQEGCMRPGSGNIGHTTAATGTIAPFGETQVTGLTCLGGSVGSQTELFGSFTFTGANGSVSGDMTGIMDPGFPELVFPEHMTVVITGGTGDFEGATGTLTIEGVFRSFTTAEGTVTGSITVPPNTPTSQDDCKNDGWRDFVDENGEPFKNQGDCIAWVNHNT